MAVKVSMTSDLYYLVGDSSLQGQMGEYIRRSCVLKAVNTLRWETFLNVII